MALSRCGPELIDVQTAAAEPGLWTWEKLGYLHQKLDDDMPSQMDCPWEAKTVMFLPQET